MKSIRRNHRVLGVIAVTLVCLTLAAAPASASIEEMGMESGIEAQDTLGNRVVDVVSGWGNDLMSFLRGLGSIFAGQSGSSIVD